MKRRPFSKKYVEEVPNVPGVYEILDAKLKTIYAGKSNHLGTDFSIILESSEERSTSGFDLCHPKRQRRLKTR